VQRTAHKLGFLSLDLVERGKVQNTGFETYFEQKRIAGFEAKTLHFAVFEMNFLDGGSAELDQAKIAGFKTAVHELEIFKIG
jgi:hypothetical protein